MSLSTCLAGWAERAAAYADTDGDGLTDAEEKARVRTAPFGPQQVITTAADSAISIFAVDLDGDGYPDVLSAALISSWPRYVLEIAWYENRLEVLAPDFQLMRGDKVLQSTSAYAAKLSIDDR